MNEGKNAKFNTDKQLKYNLATALFRNAYDKKFNICQQSICKHGTEQTIPSLEMYVFAVDIFLFQSWIVNRKHIYV